MDRPKKKQNKAHKLLEEYNNFPRDSIEEVYIKAQLTKDEVKTLKTYSEIIDEKLIMYAPKWLMGSPANNIIRFLAQVLKKLESKCSNDEITSYLKILFSKAMDYRVEVNEKGYRLAPKQEQFFDILFEWEIIDFYIDQGYRINLNIGKCKNGQVAEFSYYSNDDVEIYVEAKNLNRNEVLDIIYGDIHSDSKGKGSFSLDDKQQNEIRKRFDRQARRAIRKFDDTNLYHEIWIQVPLSLRVLGKKLIEQINTLLGSNHNNHLLKIVIVTDYKWYFYDMKKKQTHIIEK